MLAIVLLLLVFALVGLFAGALLFFQDPRRPANRSAALISLSVSVWLALNALDPFIESVNISLIVGHLTFFATVPMVAGWIGLASLASLNQRPAPRWAAPVTLGVLAVGGILTLAPNFLIDRVLVHALPYGFNDYVTDSGELLYLAYFVGLMFAGFFLIERKMQRSIGIERVQFQYLFFSAMFAFIGGVLLNAILPLAAGISLPWAGPMFGIFWIAGIGYAMTKHHLLDVEVVASEVFLGLLLVLSLLTVVGAATQGEVLFGLGAFVAVLAVGMAIVRMSTRAALARAVTKRRQWLLGYLARVHSQVVARLGVKALLRAFRRSAARVPAYRQILQEQGLDYRDIKTVADFERRVPILDKHSTFARFPLPMLCLDDNTDGIVSVLTSSGHSGVFSFSVNTAQNLVTSARSIDLGLEYAFGIDTRRSLLINALPMGVKVRTERAVLSETSVREDMVWANIRYFSPHFDQTIMVGEGSFIKKIVEEGSEHGVEWDKHIVHVIVGEEGVAEGWRRYIQRLLGHDPDRPERGMIGSSMGIAELDLNIFHETRDTIRIRRLAHEHRALGDKLFGGTTRALPMLFQYYPHRTFVEVTKPAAGTSELVVSMLSTELKLPLIRYNTKDIARVYAYDDLVLLLRETGHEHLAPQLHLPLVAVYGRGKGVQTKHHFVTPEEIKEGIYHHFAVAAATTGNFKMSRVADGNAVMVHIQARRGVEPSAELHDKLMDGISVYSDASVRAKWHTYEAFPWNMSVDYERKFNYLLADET